jgi:isoleucyl-tRNA synthetase
MRVWVTSQDYTADVSNSEAMMNQLAESYRKIRNTFRWVLGNLDGFEPEKHAVADGELLELDRYMLQRTAELVEKCRGWYEQFEFHRVFHAIHDFCVVDLSAFYFDVLKDRLYTFAKFNPARRSGQTAIYRIAHALLRLLAPITVFTAEEIWKFFPRRAGEPDSIHMALFPSASDLSVQIESQFKLDLDQLLSWRENVLKKLEEARQGKFVTASLEAKIVLELGLAAAKLLKRYDKLLRELLITSQVEIRDGIGPQVGIIVERADGTKCERCWNYSTRVGENAEWPTVCERCVAALEEIRSYGPEFAAAQQGSGKDKTGDAGKSSAGARGSDASRQGAGS